MATLNVLQSVCRTRPEHNRLHCTLMLHAAYLLKYVSSEFDKAAEDVKNIKTRPSDQELLELYGLYKQANVGDINIDKPGMMDMKGKAKWESWNSRKGMSKEDAMTAYVTLAKEIIAKYGM